MSALNVPLVDMHSHLVAIAGAAHLAKAAQEAAERALSDVVAEAHHQDFGTYVDQLLVLISGPRGLAIIAALADELQAIIVDLGDDDHPGGGRR